MAVHIIYFNAFKDPCLFLNNLFDFFVFFCILLTLNFFADW